LSLGPLLTAGLVAACASLGGAYLVRAYPAFTRRTSLLLVAFAGGTVLGAVFLHLLPEAVRLGGAIIWPGVLAAFLGLYLIESHTLPHVHGPHSGDADVGPHVHLGHLAALGFVAHAVSDGLALGVGYRQSFSLAAPALIAVFAHKVPEGMAVLSLLQHGGFAAPKAMRLAWVVAWMTPFSAVVSYALVGDRLRPVHMGLLLAFVAGSFLYIAASDLLPEVRRSPKLSESLLIIAGVLVMLALKFI
jgi:zinc transporter ZupT